MSLSAVHRTRLTLLLMILVAALATATLSLQVLHAQEDGNAQAQQLLAQLARATGGRLQTTTSPATGNLEWVRVPDGGVLVADDASRPAAERAYRFLDSHGALLGIQDPTRELALERVDEDGIGQAHVRFTQVYRGVPVFGAQLIVHLSAEGVTGINGTFVPAITIPATATIPEAVAALTARGIVAKQVPGTALTTPSTTLHIYRAGLLEGKVGENRLAYAVEVAGEGTREQVWVDARTGALLNQISLTHEDLYRVVYTPEYNPADPNANVVREEGDPPISPIPGLNPIDNLYDFSGQTYNLFFNGFGRDSYDGAGQRMRTVYLVNANCPNAYWNGVTTNYCPGFDLDDVVAHEWGHAYTEYTHGLIYQYQSGALNESYSDVWGETLDLFNNRDGIGGSNNQTAYPAGQRWLVGEDLGPVVQPALLRNMWDPTTHPITGGDPDKVTSPNYYCGTGDGGGVHTNSGVANHAFAMLVDGKVFNGQTVTGIGFVRATNIYWRSQDVYQVPTTNFPQHADALEASCNDLIGQPLKDFRTGQVSTDVITAATCQEVADANAAVEFRTPPTQCNYQPLLDPNTPPICSGAATIFEEDWQSGSDGWTFESQGTGDSWPGYNWTLTSTLPISAPSTIAMYAVDPAGGTCAPGGDLSGRFAMDSPAITAGATDTYVRFEHWVATEAAVDGGNLKISVNGGTFTLVPDSAYTFNPYNVTLRDPPPLDQNTNPLAGQRAWSGTDGGTSGEGSWGTTVLNLNGVVTPGQTFKLRWDYGIDGCGGVRGWYVDRIQVYTCGAGGEPTLTPTVSPTASTVPSATATRTPGPSPTATRTPTPEPNPSATASRTPTAGPSPTRTPTRTATTGPSATATRTSTAGPSPTVTRTSTARPSATTTRTATVQPFPTVTATGTVQAPATATRTATAQVPTTATRTATVPPTQRYMLYLPITIR